MIRDPRAGGLLSLRVSITTRCSLRCRYCAPPKPEEPGPDLPPENIVRFVRLVTTHFPLSKLHLTGGEPLEHPDVVGLVRELGALGLPDFALTTNGQALAEKAADLRRAGLRRVNVNLPSLREDRFFRITRGGDLSRTLRGIEEARRAGLSPVKINVTVLRGENDDEAEALVRFGAERGCPVRFIELMPVGVAAAPHPSWFVSSAETLERLGRVFDLAPLERAPGSTSREFRASDGNGLRATVGLVSSLSEPFCGDCTRVRFLSSGRLVGCLAHGEGIDVLPLLRAGEESAVVHAVRGALGARRGANPFATQESMVRVGG